MEVAQKTIEKRLKAQGFTTSVRNIMTVKDGLQWEDREDYNSIQDAIDNVIEDYDHSLEKDKEGV